MASKARWVIGVFNLLLVKTTQVSFSNLVFSIGKSLGKIRLLLIIYVYLSVVPVHILSGHVLIIIWVTISVGKGLFRKLLKELALTFLSLLTLKCTESELCGAIKVLGGGLHGLELHRWLSLIVHLFLTIGRFRPRALIKVTRRAVIVFVMVTTLACRQLSGCVLSSYSIGHQLPVTGISQKFVRGVSQYLAILSIDEPVWGMNSTTRCTCDFLGVQATTFSLL